MNLGVIIAAGGIGSRMGAGSSKQLLQLAGMPVVARTLAIFNELEAVKEIVVAIGVEDSQRCWQEAILPYRFTKVVSVVPGGRSRAHSVRNALDVLGDPVDIVAVHDGARPLFPPELFEQGLKELRSDASLDGVVYGLPVIDTIKEVEPESLLVATTPDRSRLWAAQTPQIFRRPSLEKAFDIPDEILEKATDDAFLVECAGGRVKMVPGSRENIKLTEPLDMIVAEQVIKQREK